jgi:hypothetical protein
LGSHTKDKKIQKIYIQNIFGRNKKNNMRAHKMIEEVQKYKN